VKIFTPFFFVVRSGASLTAMQRQGCTIFEEAYSTER
jgi:hypothetical protein